MAALTTDADLARMVRTALAPRPDVAPDPTPTTRPSRENDDAILEEARSRWDKCNDAEQNQRDRIMLAKQFRTGDQWPVDIRNSRKGSPTAQQGMPPLPARPCLTIDRLSQPVRQVSNTIKTANFAIDVLPNGFGANTDTAEIFKGYLRYVQNASRGESPIEWAADQALEGGIGWFRIVTDYVYENTDGVPPEAIADQTLGLRRIANNLTVYCDPWATRPTRSDAKFMFITEDMHIEEFQRRYPKADLAGMDDFVSSGNGPKGWVDKDTIRVAEYWRIVYQEEYWAELGPNQWTKVEKLPKANGHRTRTIKRPVVEGYKIIATEILEEWGWVGSRIPIIPVLGEEYNVDGRVFVRGLIEPAMDAQRMVNYTYSGAIEIFALGSKAQYVVADDQVSDYKNLWQTANLFNYSYLPYKAVAVGGTVLPRPERDVSEAPIQAAAMLLQVSEEGIKATTGIYDPSLGQNNPQLTSGRMTQQLQGQADLTSSNYPDNVKRALIYAGELMVEIAPKITRPGQLLHILGKDDQPEEVIIGQPFQTHNGRAVPMGPAGQPPLQAPPPGGPMPSGAMPAPLDPLFPNLQQGLVKFFDLTLGKYAITVSVGKSFTTQREEGIAAMGQLMPALTPEMAAVTAPEFVENLSFPGAKAIAEKMRRALPPALQDPDPQNIMNLTQQLQQAQAMIQQLQPLAQKNQVDLQRTQIAEQAQTQRSSASDQASLLRTEITAAASMANAQAKVDAENLRSFADALEQRLSDKLDLHMQTISAALEHSHELNLQRQQQAHDVQLAALEHGANLQQQAQQQGADLQQSAQEHAQTLQQQAQQAALAPSPTDQGASA